MVISLTLTALALAASVFEVFYVGGKSDGYAERIKEIDDLVIRGSTDEAARKCKKLEADRDNESRIAYTMLSHDTVDSVSFCISRMNAYIDNGNKTMYFSESAGAKKGLASIKGSEYPLIENIL